MPLPASTSVRRALREARDAIADVAADALTDDAVAAALRAGLAALEQEARIAIVLLDELDAPPIPLARARAVALDAVKQLDVVLAAAYQGRLAATRGVLASCHAVARLSAALYAIPTTAAPSRWN